MSYMIKGVDSVCNLSNNVPDTSAVVGVGYQAISCVNTCKDAAPLTANRLGQGLMVWSGALRGCVILTMSMLPIRWQRCSRYSRYVVH